MRLVLVFAAFLSLSAAGLESGAFIPVGTADGRGPLAAHAVITDPVGIATMAGDDVPSLFVQTGRFGHDTGLFLYPPSGRGDHGEPVFGERVSIAHPFDEPYPPHGHIVQTKDGVVRGLWLAGTDVVHCVLDTDAMGFEEVGRIGLDGLPRNAQHIGIHIDDRDAMTLFASVSDGTPYRTFQGSTRDPEYDPYDGRGIWRGGHPYVGLWSAPLAKDWSAVSAPFAAVTGAREVRTQMGGIDVLDLGPDRPAMVLTGSHYGPLCSFALTDSEVLGPRRYLVRHEGVAIRHPIIHPSPIAFPNADGQLCDVVAGGEGGLYWYRFTGAVSADGNPVYGEPRFVLEEKADLYGGTLPVPNVVDWDGDGDEDLVVGNSEGQILFFANEGSNDEPAFAPGEALRAGGEVIHIQPGYAGDIQGPGEARWGYVCPAVVDWDQDGDFDVVLSDSTAKHTYFENGGSHAAPALRPGVPIYYDGLDLYGTWRVKPAAALMGGRMAYVALDDEDVFHLYWQEDARNVTDGFQLTLESGEVIRANFLDAGGTGRLKINLYDWDQDGSTDLIVGTPRHGSVPDPERGLPQSLGLPGSAVLFLKNVGSDTEPRFAWPQLFAFRGEPLFVGQHACGPAVADFGGRGDPGLVLGEESGRMYYFAREDLSVVDPAK